MKKIVIIGMLTVLLFIQAIGQVPEKFNYQGILRNSSDDLVINTSITIKISLLQGSTSGTVMYSENHTVSTNNYGQFTVYIGDGSVVSGVFSTIDWSQQMFIKTEIANPAGGTLVDMGIIQLISVPYSLYAKNVENKDDDDADPENEIQDLNLSSNILTITNKTNPTQINLASYQGTNTDEQQLNLSGTILSISGGNNVDLSPIQDGVEDADADPSNELQILTISNDTIYLSNGGFVKLPTDQVNDADADPTNELQNLSLLGDTLQISNGNQVVFQYDSSQWANNGEKLYFNTGNVGIGTNDPNSKLEIKSSGTGALFQVINANNDTVFAVYPDGVKVFVDPDAKGKVGGFAISGRTPTKEGLPVEYFRVTPDSTRIYVNDSIGAKGKVGGFAISGRTPTKENGVKEYFTINRDSTRIYIDSTASKGKVGGFAISGRTPTKAGYAADDYFNISAGTSADIISSDARVAWYPKKEAFLTGRVLVESPDSVGTNSMATGFESKAIGDFSQAMGYKAVARGNYSTAIGDSAVASGLSSFSFGDQTFAIGDGAYAFGRQSVAKGINSYAFGANIGASLTQALKENSFAFGLGSVSNGVGAISIGTSNNSGADYSFTVGRSNTANKTGASALGHLVTSSGDYSTALGYHSTASGNYSTALGYETNAIGLYSTVLGKNSSAGGESSVSFGWECSAAGKNSTAMGYSTEANGDYSFASGWNAVTSGFQALSIGYNSNAGPISIALGYNASATGQNCIAIGQLSQTTDWHGIAIGYNTQASKGATAVGHSTQAFGQYSLSAGYQPKAYADYSVAIGDNTRARAQYSTAIGFWSETKGDYSFALGRSVIAKPFCSFVIGQYNDTSFISSTSWELTDPLFIVGNGIYPSYSNAFMVRKDGNAYVYKDFSVSGQLYSNGWVRVNGNQGIYFQSYGGGWYMTDTQWIRTYGSKSIYHNSGTMRTDGTFQVGSGGGTLNVINEGDFSYRSNVIFANTTGNVGIGTSAPVRKLHVYESGKTGDYAAYIHHDGNNFECHGLRIAAGPDSPYAGTTYMITFADGDGSGEGSISLNNGAISYNTSSDRRLKTNIAQTEIKGIETIKQMPVVDFAFKDAPNYMHTGFIAQDIEKAFPEAVSINENGYLQLALPTLVPVLTKAIQEQQGIIESQNAKINELIDRVLYLEKLMKSK